MTLRRVEATPESLEDIHYKELHELQEFTWSRECERAEQIVSASRYTQAIRLLETAAILKDWSQSIPWCDGVEKDISRVADELAARSRELWDRGDCGGPEKWTLNVTNIADNQDAQT